MPFDTSNQESFKNELVRALQSLANGDFSARLPGSFIGLDGKIAESFNALAEHNQNVSGKLNEWAAVPSPSSEETVKQNWVRSNLARFSEMLQGQQDLHAVGKLIFTGLASVVSADHAIFYVMDEAGEVPELKYLACYSCTHDCACFQKVVKVGEGRIGRCALEKKKQFVTAVIEGCIRAGSGEKTQPMSILVLPVMFQGKVEAVIELASMRGFAAPDHILIEELSQSLGVVLHTIEAEIRTRDLLKQSQALGRELQKQQQKLIQANEELEEKASLLALQKGEVEKKNREIEQARQALQEKAVQLGLTSKYKSEFLANMSHELRTPLNSMLLLARQLMENQEQTMTPKQVEFAKVIHGAGNELLRLINDILDLSKIESGTVTVDVGEMQFWELQEFVERNFRLLAKSKELEFSIDLVPSLPASMQTDGKRLEQILKNLLANAFKFTSKGKVCLRIFPAISGWNPENGPLNRSHNVVAFEVSDTGIGIPADKHKLIFESFQQGDGSTNRRFGGTGLGLTISREIAHLLGGEIQLRSTSGEGSVFTLYLPCRFLQAQPVERNEGKNIPVEVYLRDEKCVLDDRGKLQSGDRVLLCIEDEVDFAACLLDLAREHGFKGLIASRGTQAMELIRQYKPDAITLDLTLPDVDGWKLLSRLKDDPATRHIPVSIISADEERVRGLKSGAAKYLVKPAPRSALKNAFAQMKSVHSPHKSLLYVSASETEREHFSQLIGSAVRVTAGRGGQAALGALKHHSFDCVVLDVDLPDMTGIHLLKEIKQLRIRDLPILVYAKRKLTPKEQRQVRKLEESLIVKEVSSPERLIDQVSLFLHLSVDRMSEPARRIVEQLHGSDAPLTGKQALIVDDDLRNIFAITSLLERHGMRILASETGRGAIDILERGTVVDVVLMDIMMPGLDGYDTMRLLRQNQQFDSLPIIAVTAKAMREDRAKCVQAGASDYVPKPVDSQQLLSTLRMWLHR